MFSPAVHYAVYEGLHEAARSGMGSAGAAHLAVGLFAVPGGAAARLMVRVTGDDWGPDSAAVRVLATDARALPGSEPYRFVVNGLVMYRLLPASWEPRFWTGLWRLGIWWITESSFRRPYRRCGARYGHPVPFLVERQAVLAAVRAGHHVVTAAHLVVALLAMHQQVAADGRRLPPDVIRWNRAGEIVAGHGVSWRAASRTVLGLPPADDERQLDGLPDRGWYRSKEHPSVPGQGRSALAALRGASLAAHRQGHPYAGTSHLLIELLADASGPAARLLRRLGVDPDAVRADARESLGQNST